MGVDKNNVWKLLQFVLGLTLNPLDYLDIDGYKLCALGV